MKCPQDYVIAYDLSDNKERNRVSKLLKGYGFRVQKSLFEIRATKTTLRQLTRALQKLQLESGFARIYPLGFRTPPLSIGEAPQTADTECAFIC